MALKRAYNVKQVVGNTDLTLTADAGEAFVVTGIYIDGPGSDYLTVQVDRTTVGYFRIGGTQGNHLFVPGHTNHLGNLLDFLREKGLFSGYPVPEGSTFALSGAAGSGATQIVTYQIYDAGDIRPDQVNGPEAGAYEYMAYGRASGTLSDGDNAYTVSASATEFPDFPFGENVPQGKTISVLAIAASPVGKTSSSASNKQSTTYLKLIRERVVLFDEDRNGLRFYRSAPTSDGTNVGDGVSVIGGRSDVDLAPPLVLPETVTMEAGQELNVYVTTSVSAGSANIAPADAEIGFWCRVEPTGGVIR